MKKYSIYMTHTATEDLKSIAAYIANELREPDTAKKLVGDIKEAVMSLEQLPTRYALLSDASFSIQEIRKLIVDKYIAFYIVSEKDKTVTVLRILYYRRNWVNLLS